MSYDAESEALGYRRGLMVTTTTMLGTLWAGTSRAIRTKGPGPVGMILPATLGFFTMYVTPRFAKSLNVWKSEMAPFSHETGFMQGVLDGMSLGKVWAYGEL
mmetsp:Transcript_30305/g.66528  ORF Transcript_30305/g.66528 Transcript_30305/m.66528 type:complete len:102 (-) Transcript_30305:215-520(-)